MDTFTLCKRAAKCRGTNSIRGRLGFPAAFALFIDVRLNLKNIQMRQKKTNI